MKVILSRKGFDSSYGGYPSPVIGRDMISFPIPLRKDTTTYSKLNYGNRTYLELMQELGVKGIDEKTCHLDPDIKRGVLKDRPDDWTPALGQMSGSQTHLENMKVKEGDIFLFFGWFKTTQKYNGKLGYCKNPDFPNGFHALFGYLQIGEIIRTKNATNDELKHIRQHPHVQNNEILKDESNVVYVAKNRLEFNGKETDKAGSGCFVFSEDLILTRKGTPRRTEWNLDQVFKGKKISHHSDPWKNGYFKSASIGQEFVVQDDDKIAEWAKTLIEKHHIKENQ